MRPRQVLVGLPRWPHHADVCRPVHDLPLPGGPSRPPGPLPGATAGPALAGAASGAVPASATALRRAVAPAASGWTASSVSLDRIGHHGPAQASPARVAPARVRGHPRI